mgnify:CR=1 FL=1
MSVFLGALCVALIAAGSSMFTSGGLLPGLALMALGSIGLGTMFAAFQSAAKAVPEATMAIASDGLTVCQLQLFLGDVLPDTKVYVGDQGLHAAGNAFSARMNGERAIVIERLVEEEEMLTVIHPFEEVR